MAYPLPPASPVPLARQVREQFVAYVEGVLPALSDAIRIKLIELVDAGTSTRDVQDRRDAVLEFERQRAQWVRATAKAWHDAVNPPTATARVRLGAMNLELIGDDVVEKKILSSRLALAVREKASWDLNDLKVRMQHLEGTDEVASQDILQPEAVAQLLIEQWTAAELKRESWTLFRSNEVPDLHDVIQQHMVDRLLEAYKRTNKFRVDNGVLPDIDLAKKVKRGSSSPGGRKGPGGQGAQGESTGLGDEAAGAHGGSGRMR